jgi:hypothetical protein
MNEYLAQMRVTAEGFANDGKLDSLDNLKGSPVYVFAGGNDQNAFSI